MVYPVVLIWVVILLLLGIYWHGLRSRQELRRIAGILERIAEKR
jgi:hypothetical protein